MVRKYFLIGLKNDGYRYRYTFERNKRFKDFFEEFKDILEKFMDGLNFDDKTISGRGGIFFRHNSNSRYKKIFWYKDFIDTYWNYHNKKFDVDIFFGKNEINIIVRTKEHNQLVKIVNKLFKFEEEANKKTK